MLRPLTYRAISNEPIGKFRRFFGQYSALGTAMTTEGL